MSKFILAVLPVGLTGGTLSYLMAQGVSASLPLVLGTAVVFCYVMFACGSVVLRWLGAGSLSIVAAWPLGVITSGLSLWLLTVALNATAATAFAVWGLLVLVLDVSLRRKSVAPDTNRKDLFAIAICCALTAAWCRGPAATPTALAQGGAFHAWIDYFLHGAVIAEFGDPRAIGRGDIWLADVPKFAYHYGSYLLPAAFQVPLGESGLALATSIWLPIGMLSLAAAAYALGACLAGAPGGIAALVALFVIPDASNYWLQNGFFSFHWNIVSIPGSTYAIAAGLLTVVLAQRWIGQDRHCHVP